MKEIRTCVLKSRGTNCDKETRYAFELAGAVSEIVSLPTLFAKKDPMTGREVLLEQYDQLAIPGGFSGGDYIRSGVMFAQELKHFLGDALQGFIAEGKPVIGICNGFQTLVEYGILPGNSGQLERTAALTYNDCGRFRCDWVRLAPPYEKTSACIWTRGMSQIELPIAHGEGKFVVSEETYRQMVSRGCIALHYVDERGSPTQQFPQNPNGSYYAIAGVCNERGTVFGLMPHPERHLFPEQHPLWTLQRILGQLPTEGAGLQIFRNAVEYSRRLVA